MKKTKIECMINSNNENQNGELWKHMGTRVTNKTVAMISKSQTREMGSKTYELRLRIYSCDDD